MTASPIDTAVLRTWFAASLGLITLCVLVPCGPGRAVAQSSLADDVIAAQGDGGRTPRPAASLRPGGPGGRDQPIIGGVEGGVPILIPQTRAQDFEPAGRGIAGPRAGSIGLGQRLKSSPALILETPDRLPNQAIEGPIAMDIDPPGGLTLDAAIDRLLATSLSLRSALHALPAAQADVLTAGLRTNPLVFYGAGDIPYGSFSEQRPGETEHAISLVHPIDWNGKRRKRIAAAEAARTVLEAQFQDVVRAEIDQLSRAFVDVLAERESLRMRQRRAEWLRELLRRAGERVEEGVVSKVDYDGIVLEYEVTRYLIDEAEEALWEAKLELATLLDLPPGTADHLEVSGSLRDTGPPPPPLPELVRIALCERPDLVARRLEVTRDRATVARERAERFADAFVLYQPFTYTDNSAVGARSATSWAAGVFVSVPLYDRNQGEIRRAELDLSRTRIDLTAQERRAVAEVERAVRRYYGTLQDAERLEREVLPLAARRRDALLNMLLEGFPDTDIDDYLAAQRDYGSILRQLLDVLIDHRRSMIELNSVVGRRIMP